MAISRVNIDTTGKGILELFSDNMDDIAALNKLSAGAGDANTYDGPDGEVKITWPRRGVYNDIGATPGALQEYNVREINMPPDGIDIPLTADEADSPASPLTTAGAAVHAGKSSNALEDNDNVYESVGAVGSGRGPQGSFMATKGRKSLYTLLQETMGVFFDGDRGPVYRNPSPASPNPAFRGRGQSSNDFNRYGLSDDRSYDDQFLDAMDSAAVVPDGKDLRASAQSGFNLGQIIGPDPARIDEWRGAGANVAREFFEDLASTAILENNQFLADWYQMMSGIVIGDANRPQSLYRPGLSRPSIPGEYGRKSQLPLLEMLEQNLLLPTGGVGLGFSTSQTGESAAMEDTFEALYTSNRATDQPPWATGPAAYSNGMIAGTGVNDLQEPIKDLDGVVATQDGQTVVPFSFREDDAVYLTYPKQRQGFIGNTEATATNPEVANVAVRDFTKLDNLDAAEAHFITHTDGQYFPFAFSTVNKKDQRVQVCTLQATIQNLSESYNPTWQSKHFFGRSEQVHTYTFTDRTIDITFAVFADSMRQLQNVYERVLWLAQQCYPDYSDNDRIGGGPIIAMRIGDLFKYKSGFIRSLSYDWNYLGGAGGKWELTKGVRMPQACSVSMSYQIIHEKVPDRDYNFYGGGPDGGINDGMRNLRFINYGTENQVFDVEDAAAASQGTNRYIGSNITQSGEDDYLSTVKTKNS